MQTLEIDALVTKLHELRSTERRLLVDFLEHLAELDRRKLYLELSYGSCFAYCTDALGLTESSAYRRVAAARLLARFPVVTDYLRDGRLCVTTLVELAGVLNEDNLHDRLARAAGKTQRQIQRMVRPVELHDGDPLSLNPRTSPLRVVEVAPGDHLLALGPPDEAARQAGRPWATVSWLLLLEPLGADRCRLISRFRADYSDDRLTRLSYGETLLEPISFAMDRRMLLGVKERVESRHAH